MGDRTALRGTLTLAEVLSRSTGGLRLSLVRSGVVAYDLFAWREGFLGKRAFVRVLVAFREQPSKELSMQLRGVLVIDGDLRGVKGLDQATY